MDDCVDVKTAAQRLGVTPTQVYRLIAKGKLGGIGGRLVVPLESIQVYQRNKRKRGER